MTRFGIPLLILGGLGLVWLPVLVGRDRAERDQRAREAQERVRTFNIFTPTSYGAYVTSPDCGDTLFLYATRGNITELKIKY